MIDSNGNKLSDDKDLKKKELLEAIRFEEVFGSNDDPASAKSSADAYDSLGRICLGNKEYDEALTYAQKALTLYKGLHDRDSSNDTLWDLAYAYSLLRDIYENKGEDCKDQALDAARKSEDLFGQIVTAADTHGNRKNYAITIYKHAGLLAKSDLPKGLEKYHEGIAAVETWPDTSPETDKLYYLGWGYRDIYLLLESEADKITDPDKAFLRSEKKPAARGQYKYFKAYAELLPDDVEAQVIYAHACERIRRCYRDTMDKNAREKMYRYTEEENRAFFALTRHDPVRFFSDFYLTSQWMISILENHPNEETFAALSDRMQRACRKTRRFLDRRTAEDSPDPLPIADEISLRSEWAEAEMFFAAVRKKRDRESTDHTDFIDCMTDVINTLAPRILWIRQELCDSADLLEPFFDAYEALFDMNSLYITTELRELLKAVAKPVMGNLSKEQKDLYNKIMNTSAYDDIDALLFDIFDYNPDPYD